MYEESSKIRKFQKTELKAYLETFHACQGVSDSHDGLHSWTDTKIAESLQKDLGWAVWGAEKVLSFAIAQMIPDGIEITVLMTHPDFRRRGMGQSLIKGLTRSEGTRKIWLEVHALNGAAQNLYSSLGFQVVGRRSKYYQNGGDCLLLELLVAPIKS